MFKFAQQRRRQTEKSGKVGLGLAACLTDELKKDYVCCTIHFELYACTISHLAIPRQWFQQIFLMMMIKLWMKIFQCYVYVKLYI